MCYCPAYHPLYTWTRNCFFATCLLLRQTSRVGDSARADTVCASHRSKTSRVTLTTTKSAKKLMATHPSNTPTGTRLGCSSGTGPRRGASRTSWTYCHRSTSPTDWSCDISTHTRPHSVRRPLIPRHRLGCSRRSMLTAKFDRRCSQANIQQMGTRKPLSSCLMVDKTIRGMGIWNRAKALTKPNSTTSSGRTRPRPQ